jgi:DNA (cytosine-5)-methyltransferase 1
MSQSIKIFELFSGYGGASWGLNLVGIPHQLVGYSEINKYASQIFDNNHNKDHSIKNYGDCTKIDPNELPDFDLLTGGFPCQAFSMAGSREGMRDPRGTLFWDIIRIAEVKKPKMMLLENVKGLLSIDDSETFKSMIHELNRIGYDVRYKVLNTKDFGVPQNRERIWFVCKYGSWDFMEFQFPKKKKLELSIRDILEPIVDKKYFLSPIMQKRFDEYLAGKAIDDNTCIDAGVQRRGEWGEGIHDGVSGTLNSASGSDFLCLQKHHFDEIREYDQYAPTIGKDMGDNFSMVYDRKGFDSRTKGFRESEMSPALSTKMGTGGNNVPMISNASKREMGFKDVSPALCARDYKDPKIVSGQLRRLSPRECFRLQGFLHDEIDIKGISDSRLYQIVGNGWSVNVVSAIFKEMYKNEKM